jgi:hypothetical protein
MWNEGLDVERPDTANPRGGSRAIGPGTVFRIHLALRVTDIRKGIAVYYSATGFYRHRRFASAPN